MSQCATNQSEQTASSAASLRVVRDPEQWDAMRPEWDELFTASPTASPPLRFEWLRNWWRIYAPRYAAPEGLRILTVYRGSRLIGGLPLYRSTRGVPPVGARRLAFISSCEDEFEETCADYLDLLHAPGEERACVNAIGDWLMASRGEWDELDLRDMSKDSPLLGLQQLLAGRCRTEVSTRGMCPMADISGGLDAYLARLSANTRQQSRRLLRAAQKAGAEMNLATDPDDAGRSFAEMVELHQRRWQSIGHPGCFAAPRFTEFHKGIARTWVPESRAVLACLDIRGQVLAVIYGFLVGSKFDFYQSGNAIDETSLKSPGTVAFLMLMDRLAERGVATFDFLRGPSSYKQRLATAECPLVRLRATRPTPRMAILIASELAGRAVRRSGRMLCQSAARLRARSVPIKPHRAGSHL